jgi:hypothetical protein
MALVLGIILKLVAFERIIASGTFILLIPIL